VGFDGQNVTAYILDRLGAQDFRDTFQNLQIFTDVIRPTKT